MQVHLGDSYMQSEAYRDTQRSLQHLVVGLEVSTASVSILKTANEGACSSPYTTNVFWQVRSVIAITQ